MVKLLLCIVGRSHSRAACSMCIVIDEEYAPAYFNRSGLYHIKGTELFSYCGWHGRLTRVCVLGVSLGMGPQALADIDKAIRVDPSNIQFRNNRCAVTFAPCD
jgi:hypothetical protein